MCSALRKRIHFYQESNVIIDFVFVFHAFE